MSGQRIGIVFAGQGAQWWPKLQRLSQDPEHQHLLEIAQETLHTAHKLAPSVYTEGVNFLDWAKNPHHAPSDDYLNSASISQPLIFLTQILTLQDALNAGLRHAFNERNVAAVTGHSQGLIAALLLAESPDGNFKDQRVRAYLEYMVHQGRAMEQSQRQQRQNPWPQGTSPMLAIDGFRADELRAILASQNGFKDLDLSVINGLEHCVVSGDPKTLSFLKTTLETLVENNRTASEPQFLQGNPLRPQRVDASFLPVSGAYHSRRMKAGAETLRQTLPKEEFPFDPSYLQIPVISCFDGKDLRTSQDLITEVLDIEFTRGVHWPRTCAALQQIGDVQTVLNVGPGRFIATMTEDAMRGRGCTALSIHSTEARSHAFHSESRPVSPENDYQNFRPTRVSDDDDGTRLQNRYTIATGHAPVILAGMTPTTADVPIVAAAANAGFTAELAGGGQVNRAIFQERVRELAETLNAGAHVVFNALYLDRYLWDLHLGEDGELWKAQQQHGVFSGVTISAGIPEVQEAVALLETLEANGLWLNAFKPGTLQQIDQVLAIADAAPHITFSVHVEGGQAGGHHSWEALDDLLLARYHALRARKNILLCAGGGIATENDVRAYLHGDWSHKYDAPHMPVDAVLIGTAAMATAEAKTSGAVKQALVDAKGGNHWVPRNAIRNGCTSGQSSLNADIHYLQNHAAACSQLIDDVLKKPDAIERKRPQIIAALNKTSRPYFGDIQRLPILEVLHRLVELMATGNHGRYEDGAWKDVTWRTRVFDLISRLEARYKNYRTADENPRIPTPDALDDPHNALQTLKTTYPAWQHEPLSGADQQFFVQNICKRPGKPVPFVPVLDQNLAKWFRADSLNDSHDERFDADQVFIIPGPASVAGITRANEPIATLLGRLTHAATDPLNDAPETTHTPRPRRRRDTLYYLRTSPWEEAEKNVWEQTLHAENPIQEFFASITQFWGGPLAELIDAPTLRIGDKSRVNPLRRMLIPRTTADVSVHIDESGKLISLHWVATDASNERVSLTQADEKTISWQFSTTNNQETFAVDILRRPTTPVPLFEIAEDAWRDALRDFYTSALFADTVSPTPLFDTAQHQGTVQSHWPTAYMQQLSARYAPLQINSLFSLSLPAIFRALLCDELAPGLLDLVHRTHRSTMGEAWPPQDDEAFEATAHVREIRTTDHGVDVTIESDITTARGPLGTVHSTFHLRGLKRRDGHILQQRMHLHDTATIASPAALETLAQQPWVQTLHTSAPDAPVELTIDCTLRFDKTDETTKSYANGTLYLHDEPWANIRLDDDAAYAEHPVHAAWNILRPAPPSAEHVEPKTLARTQRKAPYSMERFAEVSGDQNPIHRSQLAAQLAGLDAPIAHGMWTAGLVATALDEAVSGRDTHIIHTEGQFLAPLYPRDTLEIHITRQSAHDGRLTCRALGRVLDASGEALRTVYQGTLTLRAPHTAWVFPGQGIQKRGMGMKGYERSAAARAIWDQADACTRKELGFSILRVVRENPQHLHVRGTLNTHPDGVLYLTQFTQVAMAVLACAQVAELREAGVFSDGGIACGHSVGEYNALAAIAQVLPLESVVKLVYKRGLAMDTLLERDASGQSPYALGVIRPHYAGLSATEAEALVKNLQQELDLPLEIVNYNIEGRQYSVTGRKEAISALEDTLSARAPAGAKPPFVLVPGIDVPFHSTVLRDGVPRFREDLEAEIPQQIDPALLIDRYIPNLTAEFFELTPAFVQSIIDTTGSPIAQTILTQWDQEIESPSALTRKLLIELLAWQFASPVRWIETQRLLFGDELQDTGVERIAEVGVGYQPTLANMANYSARIWQRSDVEIVNIESNRDRVFFEDKEVFVPDEDEPNSTNSKEAPQDPTHPPSKAEAPANPSPAPTTEPNVSIPFGVEHGLRGLLAFQAVVRQDQLQDTDTIEALMNGVSSRRNQVLVDLGEEFSIGPVDGAHELALNDLGDALQSQAPRYKKFGNYLQKATQARIDDGLGKTGVKLRQIQQYLTSAWALPADAHPHVLLELALGLRNDDSTRGGRLQLAPQLPTTKDEAHAWIDHAVQRASERLQVQWAKPAASQGTGAVVDSSALDALREELLGEQSPLGKLAASIAQSTGRRLVPDDHDSALDEAPAEERPGFRPQEAVWMDAAWAHARKDLFRSFYGLPNGTITPEETQRILHRARQFPAHTGVGETLAYLRTQATQGDENIKESQKDSTQTHPWLSLLQKLEQGDAPSSLPVALQPTVNVQSDGTLHYEETPRSDDATRRLGPWNDLQSNALRIASRNLTERFKQHLEEVAQKAKSGAVFDFSDRVALVTGASPGSIGAEMTKILLSGGATVIVTSSRLHQERRTWYRKLYQQHAADGARLCCVPCDFSDPNAAPDLIAWLTSAQFRTVNGQRTLEKEPLVPNLVIPFAAPPSSGSLLDDTQDLQSFEIMVLVVHRLISSLAQHFHDNGAPDRPTQLIVPLSPNHGIFGGDGLYSESKAALETLRARWQSEHEDWGQYFALLNATIGWVRGTGLMEANDVLAALLERFEGVRTWSNQEMAWLLSALCTQPFYDLATEAPLDFSATGGLERIENLAATLKKHQAKLENVVSKRREKNALHQQIHAALRPAEPSAASNHSAPKDVLALPIDRASKRVQPTWPNAPKLTRISQTNNSADLSDTYVVIGYGELGPWGTSNTRFAMEVSEELSDVAVFELAWMTGLIRWESTAQDGYWVDTTLDEPIAESAIAERFRDEVFERSGIRAVESAFIESDGGDKEVLQSVYLEEPLSFEVATEALARAFVSKAPDKSRARRNADQWTVEFDKGATIRVPRRARMSRRFAGQLPTGFSFERWGIPADMATRTDRLALMNLIATVEAFLSAGLSPEELLSRVHPVRIANTQGAGMGGMESLRRMYHDHLLGEERQNDILQESLINVVASYVVQSYVGSYGAMTHPVAACATAAVSIEEAWDKLQLGKADFVVAGAFDDIGAEGMIGFGDMSATAETEEIEHIGLSAREASRPNDKRRRGFVESQGGGTLLITRANIALELGLPVHAVLGWAGSFGDGIQRSVPAPGQGLVSAVSNAIDHNLGDALNEYGLTADDIGLIYKHDTSTPANDPNENRLHQEIQHQLGRTPGNPLPVVSQKWFTGHPKGGAAAWQSIGLMQCFNAGIIPGNRNLENVDPTMRTYKHLLFTDENLQVPVERLRAGLVTSLGFGHVNALLLFIHPHAFEAALPAEAWAEWRNKVAQRARTARETRAAILRGEQPLVSIRTERRFDAPDGSRCQQREEIDTLLHRNSYLDASGRYQHARAAE